MRSLREGKERRRAGEILRGERERGESVEGSHHTVQEM